MNTIGSLGIPNLNSLQGFDISSDGTAYAAIGTPGGSQLFTINLGTGRATLVGAIGNPVIGLTASGDVSSPIPEPATPFLLSAGLGALAFLRRKGL
jgi:hypothetical protein